MVTGVFDRGGLNDAYEEYGSNEESLIVLASFHNADDQEALEWDTRVGVKYPSISEVGGTDIRTKYGNEQGLLSTPTICLIAPDKKIVEKSLTDAAAWDSLLTVLKRYDIGATENEKAATFSNTRSPYVTMRLKGKQQVELNIHENDTYNFLIYTSRGRLIQSLTKNFTAGTHTITMNKAVSHGVYFLHIENSKGITIIQTLSYGF